MTDACNLCGKAAALMCQRCMETYCSPNCQIVDWRAHKTICSHIPPLVPIKEFKIKSTSMANRSIRSESLRYRPLHDSFRGTKNPIARNPLNTTYEDVSASEFTDTRNSLPDIDFTLKPRVTSKENKLSSCSAINLSFSPRTLPWQIPFPYPEGVFFDVIVQYVGQGTNSGIVWVTELKYECQLNNLLNNINLQIDINTPGYNDDDIKTGLLVAAPLDKIFYRAEIIETDRVSKTCCVHLIDYGNVHYVSFTDLRIPLPFMHDLNAYAFGIRYSKEVTLATKLRIRVIGKEPNDVAKVEENVCKTLPVTVTADLFETNPTVSLVKISNCGNYALLKVKSEEVFEQLKEMHEFLDRDEANRLKLVEPSAEGDFVVAHTLNGWSRGMILTAYRNYYLVYLLDLGHVSLVEEICTVPHKFKAIPIQVFGVELKEILCEAKDFSDCIFGGKDFTIKALQSLRTKNDRITCYIITVSGERITEVETFEYLGRCSKVRVSDWIEPLVPGSIVHVTSVISHSEIWISLVFTKMYPKIFSLAVEDCLPLISANKGDLVLAPKESGYFRGKILVAENETAQVLDLDTGLELCVSIKTMVQPNFFVISCPYDIRKVKLLYLANVTPTYAENKALDTLKRCQATGAEFMIKFDSNPELGVELILKTPNNQSLNRQLLPLLFEKLDNAEVDKDKVIPHVLEKVEDVMETPTKSENVDTENHVYSLVDLEIIPITCGDNISLMVTDNSTISSGYIAAYDLTKIDFLQKLEDEYLPLLAKHCASTNSTQGYSPKLNEVCLAVFDVDDQWYRAICVNQLKDEMFYLMFLDYGNMCTAHKSKIMPVTKELMFPANTNLCTFKGVPKELPPEACEKFISATKADPIIVANVSKLENDTYQLSLDNMDKYF